MKREGLADLTLAFLALIWGGSFVVVKASLPLVSPFLFLALRFGLAALLLLAVRPQPRRPLTADVWLPGGLIGLALGAGFAFQTAGLVYTTPAKSAFVTGVSIVLVPAFGSLLTRRIPPAYVMAGLCLAALGLILMTYPAGHADWNRGDLLTLGCAVCFTLHILLIERFARLDNILSLVKIQIYTSALLFVLLAGLFETPRIASTPGVWTAVFFTGAIATAAAFYLQNAAQSQTTAARTALLLALEPVFASLFSYLFRQETLTAREMAGAGSILTGILLAEIWHARPKR